MDTGKFFFLLNFVLTAHAVSNLRLHHRRKSQQKRTLHFYLERAIHQYSEYVHTQFIYDSNLLISH